MSHQRSNEDLRGELKSLADTLEEVLNSSADKSKEETKACVQKQNRR